MLESGRHAHWRCPDHVIESFRNDMWPGYKTGEGVDPRLLAQFIPLEQVLESMGIATWPMVELEADDAIAAAAVSAEIVRCGPHHHLFADKDFAQCVRGDKIVQLNRRTREIRNEAGCPYTFWHLSKFNS